MNEQKITLTADRIQAEYEKGVQYNTGIGLYENVKQCENFVEGKQWEGLKSKNLRPITMNVLDPIVHYKVAQIVSNDVDQEVEPFLPDEQAEFAAKILEQSIDRVVERTKIKSMHHMVLRDACVDGDAALYFYFDASKPSGLGGVQGEICAEQVMNTNILFGNPSNSNVQEQPYLIIVRRRPVSEIRKDAKRLGCKEWETIEGESDGLYKGDDEQNNSDSLGNELVRFWKSEDGRVHYCRSCGRVLIEQDVATEMTLYPVAYMSWKPRKNCYHGVMEIKPLINTQIEINKQWTALALMLRNNAMPKLVYNRNKFPKGWDPDATSIGVTGDVKDALTGVAGSMPIPTEATGITSTMTDALKSVAGANDAALGNVKNPENSRKSRSRSLRLLKRSQTIRRKSRREKRTFSPVTGIRNCPPVTERMKGIRRRRKTVYRTPPGRKSLKMAAPLCRMRCRFRRSFFWRSPPLPWNRTAGRRNMTPSVRPSTLRKRITKTPTKGCTPLH